MRRKSLGALEGGAAVDAWYPIGSPVDIRRFDIREAQLLGRRIDLAVYKTWISPSVEGRQLPVTERLGLVWTTLGRPNGPPQPLIEYYEVDRSTLNVSSEPVKFTGPAVLEQALRMLDGLTGSSGTEGAEQDDEGSLLLRSDRADLGVLGSGIACEARVLSPQSAIFTFHHSSRAPGQELRTDFFALFCQPIDGTTTVVHKVAGIVDFHFATLESMRRDYPFVAHPIREDRGEDGDAESSQWLGHSPSSRSEISAALRGWIDTRPLSREMQVAGREE